jgi:hypothetical protein
MSKTSTLADIVSANSTLIVPTGNTFSRPANTAGSIRFNTDLNTLESANGTVWSNVGSGSASSGGSSSNVASITGNVFISSAGGIIDASNASIGFVFPTGTYNQRPTAVANGTTRWNSSNNWLEVYTGSTTQWVTLAYGGQYLITYLIVAGGGGGGSDMGGGGGAGGYLSGTALVTSGLSYTISVGAGGAGAPPGNYQPKGSNGNDSTFGRLAITSTGGGGGGSEYGNSATYSGNPGGSGGGAACQVGSIGGSGTSGQGYPGGNGGGSYYGGGGGGAGGAGAGSGGAANGGIGVQNSILGTNYYWAGGGGGSGYTINGGVGGAGGGGGGAISGNAGGSGINAGSPGGVGSTVTQANVPGGNAGQYTGGGGGGGSHYNLTNPGGSGGSGIIAITYVGPQRGTGGTITTVSGNPVHTFYSSGTFTA